MILRFLINKTSNIRIPNFSISFISKVLHWYIEHYSTEATKRIGYDLNDMRQSACLVIKPITVDNFPAFFNCTLVDRASDSTMARI